MKTSRARNGNLFNCDGIETPLIWYNIIIIEGYQQKSTVADPAMCRDWRNGRCGTHSGQKAANWHLISGHTEFQWKAAGINFFAFGILVQSTQIWLLLYQIALPFPLFTIFPEPDKFPGNYTEELVLPPAHNPGQGQNGNTAKTSESTKNHLIINSSVIYWLQNSDYNFLIISTFLITAAE